MPNLWVSELVVGELSSAFAGGECSAPSCRAPDEAGRIHNLRAFMEAAKGRGALVAVATDLLSLTLLQPPGSLALTLSLAALSGSVSRLATAALTPRSSRLARSTPVRCRAASSASPVTLAGTLPIEWHSRPASSTFGATRRLPTSAPRQALLANIAGFYAVYHGPLGLTSIARRVHQHARLARA